MALGAKMYENQNQQNADSETTNSQDDKNDNVSDAEYEEK